VTSLAVWLVLGSPSRRMVRSILGALKGLARTAVILVVLGASACASKRAPASPSPEPAPEPKAAIPVAEAPAPAEATPVDAGSVAADTQAPPDASSPAPETTETKRTQKPIDMLTARDAAFLLDYANSDAKRAAETACDKEAKDDAEKRGACLTKARDKFMPDVLKFRRDSETQISLLVYKRSGSVLREVWVGVVELSESSSDAVKVKLTGRQKGTRPLWRGRSEVVLSVPNEYSIEFDDPDHGHLRYDAKIGLVSQ
jgi:hypothetical protein